MCLVCSESHSNTCDAPTEEKILGNNLNNLRLFAAQKSELLTCCCRPPADEAQQDEGGEQVEEPYITAFLHSHPKPNEFNCTEQKRITLSATRGQERDHRKYTFFLSPE